MQPCWGTEFRCRVEGAAPGRHGELMRAEPGGCGELMRVDTAGPGEGCSVVREQ